MSLRSCFERMNVSRKSDVSHVLKCWGETISASFYELRPAYLTAPLRVLDHIQDLSQASVPPPSAAIQPDCLPSAAHVQAPALPCRFSLRDQNSNHRAVGNHLHKTRSASNRPDEWRWQVCCDDNAADASADGLGLVWTLDSSAVKRD